MQVWVGGCLPGEASACILADFSVFVYCFEVAGIS